MWKCVLVRKVWSNLLSWWGLTGNVYIEDLESMWGSARIFLDIRIRMVWLSILAASMWTIWLEKNGIIFSGFKVNGD